MRRAPRFILFFVGTLLLLQGAQSRAQSTRSAPGSLTDGNVTFVFGVDENQQVFADQAVWGSGFSGWSVLPGGELSLNSIGASYFSNAGVLFAFLVEDSHQVSFNQAVYGQSWDGWQPAPPIISQFGVASTTSTKKNKVYAFAVEGGDVMVTSATYGNAFSPWAELPGFIAPQAASTPAALTLPETDTQWVFVQGEDEAMIYTTMPGGTPSGKWNYVPIGSISLANNGPTAVADSSHIYVFATDALTGHIFMAVSTNHKAATAWSNWQQIGTLTSDVSPSASIMSNGEIMLYATSIGGEIFLAQGSASGVFTGWQQLGPF